jgi:hypothetical protein
MRSHTLQLARRTLQYSQFYAEPYEVGTNSATMSVNVVVRKYAAFSAARLPAAVGILSGSGLTAP